MLRYLGRYTHRVAISNHRLVSFADGKVTFRWRDSAHNNEQKLLTLAVDEFLRRFLLHLLPEGFVRIRNFGFLANRRRATTLPLCFQLLGSAAQAKPELTTDHFERCLALPQMWWPHAGHRKAYRYGAPAPFSADQGCRRRMKSSIDITKLLRASARYLAFCLAVQPIPFLYSPQVILTAPHLSFQLLFFSPAWVLCFSAPPRDAAKPTLPSIEFA